MPKNFEERERQKRNLVSASVAHLIHDDYTDQFYAFLPIWQSSFGLSYAGLALLRVLYHGTMGAFQVPADKWFRKVEARTALAVATFIAAVGVLITAFPGGLVVLGLGLFISGLGSSVQHPSASVLVTNTYGKKSRGPLGLYNFAGDLGKAVLPAVAAVALPFMAWRHVRGLMGVLGFMVAGLLLFLIPKGRPAVFEATESVAHAASPRGFKLLLLIGALDTAPRMGYLLFLPFLIHDKGGSETMVGVALALLFIGGALGKAACGWLGEKLGIVLTVVATEAATAILMLLSLLFSLPITLVLLPMLGVALNGTSSVLYGTVPDLAPKGDTGRAFALFYTAVIVSGGVAPIAYGILADHSGRAGGTIASALTAAVIIPLVFSLRPALTDRS